MESKVSFWIGLLVFALVFGSTLWLLLNRRAPAQFCGGIMGQTCPFGYTCKYDGVYPDASGTCIHLLDSAVFKIKSILKF